MEHKSGYKALNLLNEIPHFFGMNVASVQRGMKATKGWSHMNKRLYLIPGMSLLLLAGCFEDSHNSGLGAGTGLYRGASINQGQLGTVPQDVTRTGNGSTTTTDPTQNGQAQGQQTKFFVRKSADRKFSSGNLWWQQQCKNVDGQDLTSGEDTDGDSIPDDCEKKIGTDAANVNSFVAVALQGDSSVLIAQIKERRNQLNQGGDNDKKLATAITTQLNIIEKEIQARKRPGITLTRTRIENSLLGTTVLNRLFSLYISAFKTPYDSDIAIFQKLYVNLSDPEQGGSPTRGHKLISDLERVPSIRLKTPVSIFADEPFAIIRGGMERNEHLYLNLEDGESQRYQIGGVGGNIETAKAGGDLLVIFYENFYDQQAPFDAFVGSATSQNYSSKMEGAVFAYSGGSLKLASADLGEGLGNVGVDGNFQVWKKSFWQKHPSLKIGPSGDIISNTIGSRGSHFLAMYVVEQKTDVTPAQLFGHFRNPNEDDAKEYGIELLPGHIGTVCPTIKSQARYMVAYETLQYCPGYEKFWETECGKTDPRGLPKPCPSKYGNRAAPKADLAGPDEEDASEESDDDATSGNKITEDERNDLVADLTALQTDFNDNFTTGGSTKLYERATREQLATLQQMSNQIAKDLAAAKKVKRRKRYDRLVARYEKTNSEYQALKATISAQPAPKTTFTDDEEDYDDMS